MKRYKLWQAPVFAFFSTQFYRELGQNSKGVCFVYLFVLLSFATAIIPLKECAHFRSILMMHGRDLIEQMPTIQIESGKLSIKESSPFFISDPETGNNLIAFDTSGQTNVPSELEVPMLITSDGILARTPRGDFQTKFNGIQHLQISAKDMMNILSLFAFLIPFVHYVIELLSAWAGHIAQALILSLVGLLLARSISVDIKYEGILRIAAVALGNVILLDGIMELFPLYIPGLGLMDITPPNWFLYKLVLAIGFTLFGVGANLSSAGFKSVSDEPESVLPES